MGDAELRAPKVHRLAVRGITLEAEECGEGGRPFVLVHGYTGSRDDFREQLPHLARLGRCIAIDQRGHGGSDNPGDLAGYTLDALASDLEAALDALGVERCDLLGHSMGGMVALRLALAHPGRVASLVLMDTAARPVQLFPRAVWPAALAFVAQRGLAALGERMREGARANPNRPPAQLRSEQEMGSERYWARIRAKLDALDPAAFAALLPAMAEQESLLPRLHELRCPCLVIVGEQDVPFLGPSAELARGIAGAELVVVPDAAHSPQLESPDAWRAAVLAHLARARRAGAEPSR